MSFSAQWLALREPYDAQARNGAVLDAVLAAMTERSALGIVDLACGTGSTLRALAPRIAAPQTWRLVDNNLSLLARVHGGAPPHIVVHTMPVDLAHDLEAALDGAIDLITTSALLDLVSEEWLERLAVEAAARHLPVYAALTYDGRVTFDPVDPIDAKIVAAVNRHQRRDKGFGPALGPQAASAAARLFERVGYVLVEGRSDWTFRRRDNDIQAELLAGWAAAAIETGEVASADVAAWLGRRRAALAAGASIVHVGHVDLFARPAVAR